MSKKIRKRTITLQSPIRKAKCEDCGALLVKAPKAILHSGRILCKECVKKRPYSEVLRWC